MKIFKLLTSIAIALTVLVTGCKEDDFAEVEGNCPMVVTTDPDNLATFAPINQTITATFNVNMNPESFTPESFILQNAKKSSDAASTGDLSYDAATKTVSFVPSSPLSNNTNYTARIRSTVNDLNGIGMAADYVWNFTTFSAIPGIVSSNPLNLSENVLTNKTIAATFSTAMNDLTLTNTTFTLYNGTTPVTGVVTYAGTTASFNPDVDLLPGVEYTATITTGAQSTSGTVLPDNYEWKFTTIAAGIPFVISTLPVDLATNVPLNQVVNAVFGETMNASTISSSTFTLMNGVSPVSGSVDYTGTTATFTPDTDLTLGVTYTATITTGAQNTIGIGLSSDHEWTFSTGATVSIGPGIVNLGTSGNFAILSKAGISTTGLTSVTGDIGVSPATATAITGFGLVMDASNAFSTTPIVTGKVYASNYSAPTPAYITTAISDMENALTAAMGVTLSVITELGAGNISGMTLAPGVYKWGTGLLISGAGVTLSGGPDDTWVFQISSDFTVNGNIVLSGGAQAKNIFWVTNTQALLNTGVDFSGNIVAQTLISLKTGAKITGRLLSQTGISLDAATVVKP